MRFKTCSNNKHVKGGFSLLEMTVVLIIATILASGDHAGRQVFS